MNTIYKNISLLILFFGMACFVQAQPKAVKANKTTTEYEIDGIKVILKHSPKEIVSARLFVKGGTANYPKNKEGIENLAFALAVSGGTKSMDKIAFNTAMEKMGVNINSNTDFDFGDISLTCLKTFWDESWNLFTDAILNPAFTEKEFKLLKEQMITGARVAESDPDSHLRNLSMSNVFKGKNYEKIPQGTVESLESITLEDVRNYYKKLMGKKRIYLVVVGDVDLQDLEKKIKNSLAKLPEGSLPEVEPRTEITSSGVAVENREIATNYIRGYMAAPKLDHEDGVAMMMAMNILRDRYFEELRTKRSLSYAPSAFYASGVINNPYSVIYISTTNPKESMKVMVEELNKLKSEGFKPKELIDKQQSFLTTYYMGQETLGSQSSSLGVAELRGDWRLADEMTDKVNNVKLEDLNRVINKYTNNIIWTYLGNEEQIEDEDFVQPIKP